MHELAYKTLHFRLIPCVCLAPACAPHCCTGPQSVTTDLTSNALITVTPVYTAAVAVLDTGVQCNHPDLNVIHTKQFNFERSPDPSLPGACYDGMGHGTHVSGEYVFDGTERDCANGYSQNHR
jgi:hypothetical protein